VLERRVQLRVDLYLGAPGEGRSWELQVEPAPRVWCWGGKFTQRDDMQAAISEAETRNAEADPTAREFPGSDGGVQHRVADDLRSGNRLHRWMRGSLWGRGTSTRSTAAPLASGGW